MARVFIIHGVWGSPQENWFPWLKEELEKLGCEVIIPQFPRPESLSRWMETFERYLDKVDDETILIGHSLGPGFVLNVLEKIDVRVRGAFLVAGFCGRLSGKEHDVINPLVESFTCKDFNWQKIRDNSRDFFVYYSDDDPYVGVEKAEELGKRLGVEPIMIKGAGHFNQAAGYLKFEELLTKIKEIL